MSNWVIFAVGVFVTLLLAAGLFLTVLEFRDIERHPEDHEPESYRRTPANGRVPTLSGSGTR